MRMSRADRRLWRSATTLLEWGRDSVLWTVLDRWAGRTPAGEAAR